jgi:hypothetical protein
MQGNVDDDESEQRRTRAGQGDAKVVPRSRVICRIHLRTLARDEPVFGGVQRLGTSRWAATFH